jgi:flavin reductase (DIM6/NTAB) family NADH-FMN oxidoreductase RutF
MSNQLFRYLTTTVGLVTVAQRFEVNVMAAEWSYFVARDPLHIAVAIGDGAYTQGLIEEAGEFAVTLCSASQASIANLVGSFSGSEVDKTSSRLLELSPGVEIATPRIAGGVFSAECRVAADLELPGYKLFVGEALAVYVDEDASRDPLVKHGAMYRLGEPVYDDRIAVAAELVDGTSLRVAASIQTGERIDAPWTVSLVSADGRRRALGEVASNEYGDMFAEFELAEPWPAVAVSACSVLVERPDASPGWASVSTRLTGVPAQNGNGRVPLSAQLEGAAGLAREVNQA